MSEGTANPASEDSELLSAMEELERAQQRVAQLRQQNREKAIADVREKIKIYDLKPEELGFPKAPAEQKAIRSRPGELSPNPVRSARGTAPNFEPLVADRRSQVKPKYGSPDGQHTWAGRGKTPQWMMSLLEAGVKKEDLLLEKPAPEMQKEE